MSQQVLAVRQQLVAVPNLADLTVCNIVAAASVVVVQRVYPVVSRVPLSLLAEVAPQGFESQVAHRVVLVLAVVLAVRVAHRFAQHVVQVVAVSRVAYTQVPLALVVQAVLVVACTQEALPAVACKPVVASVAAAGQVAYRMEPVDHKQVVSVAAAGQAACSMVLAVHT